VLDADTIRVRGHRVDIAHMLAYYHEGYNAELIALELPSLSLMERRQESRFNKHSTLHDPVQY
jgi:hypothetical protein